MNHAWFNCAAGVAGDMLLGALVDAGADADTVTGTIAGLGVDGWALSFERVHRGSLTALHADVVIHRHDDAGQHGHRPVKEILALLDAADLPERVRARARLVFQTLAAAEGEVHGIDPGDVELHEVGSLDAIVDVVGVCAALEVLDIDRVWAGPIGVGYGTAATAHGRLPTPAPAVARMLSARHIPVAGIDTAVELATPTGVAVLAALAEQFGAAPPITVTATGFGAGTADPADRPNVVNVLVGTPARSDDPATPMPSPATGEPEQLLQVETNVDDVSGEVIAHTIGVLLTAGARDAWASPIVMKKGRPAHTVHLLAGADDVAMLTGLLLRETGSLGARTVNVARTATDREVVEIEIDGHRVRVKRTANRMKVEFDDAVRAAESLGRPVRDVLRQAETEAARGAMPTAGEADVE